MEKQSQSTKQQFQLLLDRANKRFGKLRELQARGDYAWSVVQPYFHKTFDSFSKLWQFQMQNRPGLLETGLQRSDLGGIASKIGQLYYNYYLRSGDPGALLESYTFYDAIQTRQYFASTTAAAGPPDPAAAARQLRFFTRFIIVCLFLNRNEEAMQLLQELQACVSSYTLEYGSPNSHNWQLVLAEVSSFVAAHVATPLPRSPASMERPFKPLLRCSPTGPIAACAPHHSRLREAILVSYRPQQVKVAELPVELYRMAQALEWQDQRLGMGGQHERDVTRHEEWADAADLGPAALRVAAAMVSVDVSGAHHVRHDHDREAKHGSAAGSGTSAPIGPAAAEGGGRSNQDRSLASSSSCPLRTPPRQLLHKPTAQQLLSSLLSVTGVVGALKDDFVLLYISVDAAKSVGQASMTTVNNALSASQSSEPLGADRRQPAAKESSLSQRHLLLCPGSQHGNQRPTERHGGGGGFLPDACHGNGSSAKGQQPSMPTPAVSASFSPDSLLAPEELLVATRRRLLLVLDSDMSRDFMRLQGQERGNQLLCLMSPTAPLRSTVVDQPRTGSLTTMALACPAQALCVLCGQLDPSPDVLQRLQLVIDEELFRLGMCMAEQLGVQGSEAGADSAAESTVGASQQAFTRSAVGDETGYCGAGTCSSAGGSSPGLSYAAWTTVFQDVLTRRLLLHFAFYRCCLAMYTARSRAGENAAYLPSCFPPLPSAADASSESLRNSVVRAAGVLERQVLFDNTPS